LNLRVFLIVQLTHWQAVNTANSVLIFVPIVLRIDGLFARKNYESWSVKSPRFQAGNISEWPNLFGCRMIELMGRALSIGLDDIRRAMPAIIVWPQNPPFSKRGVCQSLLATNFVDILGNWKNAFFWCLYFQVPNDNLCIYLVKWIHLYTTILNSTYMISRCDRVVQYYI
jgi:hypothetical protein